MAKGKHGAKKWFQFVKKPPQKQEVIIRERALSHEEYYEAEEDNQAKKKEESAALQAELRRLPKYFGRIVVILLLVILALVFWLNRDNFAPENFTNWFKTKLMGTGVGDGYPVSIRGSKANNGSFFDYEGNSVILSDTELTLLNPTGRELLSFRHSYNNPALSTIQGRFLLYNIGGTGYSIVSLGNESEKKTAPDKITAATIAKNGRYALLTEPSDFASRLDVYLPGGTLKYSYEFAEVYGTALSVNEEGSMGVVTAVQAENGKLFSKIYVFDFNKKEPIAEFASEDNMITKVGYVGRGSLCAIGDKKVVYATAAGEFTEYDYQGKNLTAAKIENGTAMVSISSYAKGGACTVLLFSEEPEPKEVVTQSYVADISLYETVFAALMGDNIICYNIASGMPVGVGNAGYDAKGISLVNERDIYVLGVREIRYLSLEKPDPVPESTEATPAPTGSAAPVETPKSTNSSVGSEDSTV